MFLRGKVRRKDGKQHRYWSVVENTRGQSDLVAQINADNTDHTSADAECRSCGAKISADKAIEHALQLHFDLDNYMAAKDGDEGPLQTCPECGLDTYVLSEEDTGCAWCELVLDECGRCSTSLTRTGAPVVLSHGDAVHSLAVLADGRLASGGISGMIKLWPKDGTGEPVVLSQGGGVVYSLAVLADGRLASGGQDGKIKLWPNDGTGEPVVLSQGSEVDSLAVLADGRLASGGYGKVKLWLVDEQKLIAALCLRAGRNLTKDQWARYIGSDTPWQPSCRDLPSHFQKA